MCIRYLADFNDLSMQQWDMLFLTAKDIIDNPKKYEESCKNKIMATLFYEPSTRTMFSFQTAMLKLGGQIIGFSEPKNSSVSKGEVLKDTIEIVSGYSDIIVIRHPHEGAAMAAKDFCNGIPLINAGDGGHLHPTQTLADLTTIRMEKGEIDNLSIGLCGDLINGRTVHSLVKALANFKNIKFYFISPSNLKMPQYLLEMLKRKGFEYYETKTLDDVMDKLDVLYMTRIQQERFASDQEYIKLKGVYVLDNEKMSVAKPDMLVMHPLPRVDEIKYEVDDDPRAVYFKQAKYGLYIRMALIYNMLSCETSDVNYNIVKTELKCTNPRCITNHEHYLTHKFSKVKSNPSILYCIYCEKQYKEDEALV